MGAQLHVQFTNPDAGWMDMTIRADGRVIKLAASYVFDTVGELVESLHAITTGETLRSIRFLEEPDLYEMAFECEDCGTIRVEIFRSTLSRRRLGAAVFEARGNALKVHLAFWRALRSLQTRFSAKDFERRWGHAFPEARMAQLGANLGRMKAERQVERR
jgi:hypothetical protein